MFVSPHMCTYAECNGWTIHITQQSNKIHSGKNCMLRKTYIRLKISLNVDVSTLGDLYFSFLVNMTFYRVV